MKNFTKSRIGKIISCLVIAAMIFTVIPAGYAFADVDDSGIDREWYNFRNNQENNGVTDRATPTSLDETAMKWAGKYGTGWGAAPTPPLILDGKIYIGCGKKVIEIDKNTGEKLRESDDMAANVGYAMNPILYADGKLFIQVGNGIIQAVDLKSLKTVWQTTKVGGQTVSPISYVKIDGTGYIYTGTWKRENDDGRFMCFTTNDDNVTVDEATGKNIKAATWQFVPSGSTKDTEDITYDEVLNATLNDADNVAKRGFYWAGAYATEKYVAVGSDDGTAEGVYTPNAVFYTLDSKTGEIIDRIDQIKGDIRTTAVYDNGYLYFATKGGLMYKVSVDADGNLGEPSYIDLGGPVTASPLVYKNKIYMGVKGPGGQFDPDAGHFFAVIDNSNATLSNDSLMYTLPIKGYPQAAALLSNKYENEDFDGDGKADGRVYIYFTYNAPPGGIYYTYDSAEQKDAAKVSDELFIPDKDKQQYCISTICADYDGTLYYKNDSCCLMAVETNPAYIKDIKVTADDKTDVSWSEPFNSRITEYDVVAKDTAKTVNLEITAAEGAEVEVDGAACNGTATVTLNGSENKAVSVVAKKDGKQRTYNLNLRSTSAMADLAGLAVNTSNTYGGGTVAALTPEFKADVYEYDADVTDITGRSFYNVWIDPADATSTVEVLAGSNNKEPEGTVIEPSSMQNQGHTRYPVYPGDTAKSETIQIKVTSENGKKTEVYKLRLLKRIDVTGITLSETSKEIAKGGKFQLKASLEPEDATNQNVIWSSLDDKVATVDENGLVTAVGAGTTDISAVSVSGSKTATCTVTVISYDAEIAEANKELAGYKDKADYRDAQKAEIDSILEAAKEKFANISAKEDIAQIVADTKAELDKVKTDAQVTEEEKTEIIAGVKNTTIDASSKLGAYNITVSWKKAAGYDVDYYNVYKSTSKTSGYKLFYTTKSGKTSSVKNSSSLTNGKRYYYKVQGVREIDGHKYYTKWSDITSTYYNRDNAKIISGVERTTIDASSKLTANSITASWKKSPGYIMSYYEVYKSTSKTSGYDLMYKSKTGTATSVKNSRNLADGTRYYYKVRGVRVINGYKYYTKWSDITSRIYNKKNAEIIAGVEKAKITASSTAYKGYNKITWKRSGSYSMSYYQVYRSKTKSFSSKYSYTTTNRYLKNSSKLVKGTRYYYKVRGVRVIDGYKYYTDWSNITYKTAK